jgi:hypothetical protein
MHADGAAVRIQRLAQQGDAPVDLLNAQFNRAPFNRLTP